MSSPRALSAALAYEPWLGRPFEAVAADLESFGALLAKWNASQNLVSRETLATLWERHILDSLQLLPLMGVSTEAPIWLIDVGSGGGLPALPLAIALKGRAVRLTLVEPVAKKVSFLRTVIRQLELPAVVHAGRLDSFDSRETFPDIVTSRALAALPELFGLIEPVFGPSTLALLHKGKDHAVELSESHLAWDFDVVLTESVTDQRSAVLQIRNLRRKSAS